MLMRKEITSRVGRSLLNRQTNYICFRSFTATPRRQMDVPTFISSFKKNFRENISSDPEFGGNLKRLQETKDKFAHTTVATTGTLKTKTSQLYESIAQKVEVTSNVAQEQINKIAKPILESSPVEKTARVLQYTTNKAGESIYKANDAVFDNIANVAEPVAKFVSKTQIAQDINSITTSRVPSHFTPDPSVRNNKKQQKATMASSALVVHQESLWSRITSRVSEKWNDMGDSMGIMSVVVEKVDSIMATIDSLSSSKLGRAEMKIRQQDPYFTVDALQEWVQEDLFPRFLRAKKLDKFLSKHTGEAIQRMWQEKGMFPLGYSLSNIQNVEIFPNTSNENGFVFSIRSIVEGKEGVSQLHVLLGIQQNQQQIWALNDIQVVAKEPAAF